MGPAIDLGPHLTPFRCGDQTFEVDLVAWVAWYARESEQHAGDPFGLIAAVQGRLLSQSGVSLNATAADAFLHAVMLRYQDLKKKQNEERMWANSTESTPSS